MNDATASAFRWVSSTAYMVLMTNVIVALIAMPAVLLFITTDTADTWHAMLLIAPFAAPVTLAAFRVIAEFTTDTSAPVVRTFFRSVRTDFRRAILVGLVSTAAGVILVVDIGVVWGTRFGALAIPVFAMLIVVLAATTMTVLVALSVEPEARLLVTFRVALVLSIRSWYLSALSLTTVAIFASFVIAQPVLGLGFACTPALYIVWANARFSLRAVLPDPVVDQAGHASSHAMIGESR